MNRIKPTDIGYDGLTLELEDGFTITIKQEYDEHMGKPWKEDDGHGPVTDWVRRDKHAGERVLCSDSYSKRYYDFAEAMKIARRDGWGLGEDDMAKLTAKLGHAPSKGQIIEAAVEHDFQILQDWCEDRWHWVGVIVTLKDLDSEEVSQDSLWGIESYGDYWKETAAEMANYLIERHELDIREDADFACRC